MMKWQSEFNLDKGQWDYGVKDLILTLIGCAAIILIIIGAFLLNSFSWSL